MPSTCAFQPYFVGQTPPSRDERLVPVHYSDIVKWELRSVDRRAAQSVTNIFFKHKKLQEAFRVYLNKFEIVVTHLFFVILCKS